MTDTTKTPGIEKASEKAADELIAVTGDKTVQRLWELGDAIVAAIPGVVVGGPRAVVRQELEAIRRHAIDKAGHDDFWSEQRLKQIGTTAARWPKADRIPEVSVDAHMEALKADNPKELLEQLAKDKKSAGKHKPVSIREVRDAIGANGGTKKTRPPTLGKQTPGQLFGEMVIKRQELRDYLRSNLTSHKGNIAAFAELFADMKAKSEQVAQSSAPAAPKPASPKPKASAKKPEKVRKGRVKGI